MWVPSSRQADILLRFRSCAEPLYASNVATGFEMITLDSLVRVGMVTSIESEGVPKRWYLSALGMPVYRRAAQYDDRIGELKLLATRDGGVLDLISIVRFRRFVMAVPEEQRAELTRGAGDQLPATWWYDDFSKSGRLEVEFRHDGNHVTMIGVINDAMTRRLLAGMAEAT